MYSYVTFIELDKIPQRVLRDSYRAFSNHLLQVVGAEEG